MDLEPTWGMSVRVCVIIFALCVLLRFSTYIEWRPCWEVPYVSWSSWSELKGKIACPLRLRTTGCRQVTVKKKNFRGGEGWNDVD